MKTIAWNIYLNGHKIDTVFDQETDATEVKRSLIDHDGYDPNITVRKAKPDEKVRKIRPVNGCAGTTYGNGTDKYPTVIELSGLCDCPDHVAAIERGCRYWHLSDGQYHKFVD